MVFKDELDLTQYDYNLPNERIAQHPAEERDLSKLLVFREGRISDDIFRNIGNYLPERSLLVFNDTKVIRARIMFRKETGSVIEILCLEPLQPADYEQSFSSGSPVEWKCIVGNLKKWKRGKLAAGYSIDGAEYILSAERIRPEGDAWRIRFEWNSPKTGFGEIVDIAGVLPLPPYMNRAAEAEDLVRYQTVYARAKGSVAAPTAGLHFTENVLHNLRSSGILTAAITLHVGAGTFKPVRSAKLSDHEMHCEHYMVTSETIDLLTKHAGKIIPVGTTAVRTLESLYWTGVRIMTGKLNEEEEPALGQWEAYELRQDINAGDAMYALHEYMKRKNISILHASTSVMIVPGYRFRMMKGLITNFHQPGSTLLLLIAAWVGDTWKSIYEYAMANNFRFLSYGDSSLLMGIEDGREKK